MSGVMPAHSWAKNLPVRPTPDCTSSRISNRSFSSQMRRSSRRNSFSTVRMPPSPWIGSISSAAVFSSIAAFSAARSPNGTWSNP
ncbi:hypothetical protein D3C87_1794070 [compost metagenome]